MPVCVCLRSRYIPRCISPRQCIFAFYGRSVMGYAIEGADIVPIECNGTEERSW
ncbi:hypothetical protein DPMN_151106 [Dreissena polymorpha]|uniref:Uncharacterized protein n=1 Tax=Dreissena polymorpha TaxID=45954 RepID=A0A9D4J3Y6_DREPO|nr:hypothetical protein DPMN_151106 [Dreissena polymorpha]